MTGTQTLMHSSYSRSPLFDPPSRAGFDLGPIGQTASKLSTGPIAIVDDCDDDIDLAKILLRKAGLTDVTAFRSGQAFVAAAPEFEQPALIFLEVKMPGLSGHDVLSWIRGTPEFAHVPVVMWSSSDDPRDIVKAEQRKAQCYAAKYPTVASMKEIWAEAAASRAESPTPRFKTGVNLMSGRNALPDLAQPTQRTRVWLIQ